MDQVRGQSARAASVSIEPLFALLEVDAAGTIEVASGSGLRYFGLQEERLVGRPAREALERAPDLERVIERTLDGHPVDAELSPDGWCFHGEPRPGAPGHPGGAIVTAVTVYDPTPAARLQILFAQLPGAVWSTDRDLRFTAVVGRAPGLVGRRGIKARPRMTLRELVQTDDPAEPAVAHHLAALAGTGSRFQYERLGLVYAVQVEPLRDAAGAVIGTVGAAVDVTERVKDEQELERSRTRLEQAEQLEHLGWFEWDVRTGASRWSDELQRIYGLEPGAFEGTFEAFTKRLHPDDAEEKLRTIFEAVRSGGEFTSDCRIVRPDGDVRMLHSCGRAITDERGATVRMLGSCLDVTDRWKAQCAAERTASLMSAVVEATADGILVVDRRGKVVAYNARFLAMWNIPPELAQRDGNAALAQAALRELEDPKAFLDRVATLPGQPDSETRELLAFRDGRLFERYSTPQRLDGQIVGRVWSFHDVTVRERLLARTLFLADAGRLLASLDVERALDGVAHLAVPRIAAACAVDLLAGAPRRLVTATTDPSATERLDVPRSVLAGHSAHWRDDAGDHMSVPLLGRDGVLGAMTYRAARGHTYSGGDWELVEEVARRAAMALENARLYREAREALRVREEFLAIAAHEIRTPLTSIHLATQGLHIRELSSDVVQKLLATIEREDRRLAQLVDDLLDVGRIRSGRLHLELCRVDLVQIVRDVAARLATQRARSGSSLVVEADAQVVGVWDRSRLEQVVTNLLSNAIKFGHGKPIRIEVRTVGARAVLTVEDQGVGVCEQDQSRIFKPFERAVRERAYGGLGLGLYIVRCIVEALGGSVRVRSMPGAGATFTVELPRELHP